MCACVPVTRPSGNNAYVELNLVIIKALCRSCARLDALLYIQLLAMSSIQSSVAKLAQSC